MIILDSPNSYTFSNASITIVDNTYEEPVARNFDEITVPEINFLVPTFQPEGMTNTVELYLAGDINSYRANHGTPDIDKCGWGPDFIWMILNHSGTGAGVYTINLRGEDATMANANLVFKYKVVENEPYVDSEGRKHYVDANGNDTTDEAEGVSELVRDVLHYKLEIKSLANARTWRDMLNGMQDFRSDVVDEDGYKAIPWWSVSYRGVTSYGNNIFMNMQPTISKSDSGVYYSINLFDGNSIRSTDPTYSMDRTAGNEIGANYFIEKQFTDRYPKMRFLTADGKGEIDDLISKYLYTLEDLLHGDIKKPSIDFKEVDVFTASTDLSAANNLFAATMDDGSLNVRLSNAIQLSGGSDGTKTADELFADFYQGNIIDDIFNPIRYRFTYIPDIGYDDVTKGLIRKFCQKRIHTTKAQIMLGDESSFASAIVDHQTNWYEDLPDIYQLAKVQSPMCFNQWVNRSVVTPVAYLNLDAMLSCAERNGNFYNPFGGYYARITGYVEETMTYPSDTADYLQAMDDFRINLLMKDRQVGAYMSDQRMCTVRISDQTDLNNEFIISSMLYDLVDIVHRQHFHFNEAEDIVNLNKAVNDIINPRFSPFAASLSVEVVRAGTVGADKSLNRINVTIDLKDINRKSDITLYLVDE